MQARPLNRQSSTDAVPFVFVQSTPLQTWVVTHGKGRSVQLRLTDLDGNSMSAEAVDIDENTIEVRFGAPETGKAICT
jgi:hypothetical protein